MDISKLCYELYKKDWTDKHISKERQYEAVRDYYNGLVDSDEEYTFEHYLAEFGYNGELYVCYNEFLNAEYLDKEYMNSLLKEENLIKKYEMNTTWVVQYGVDLISPDNISRDDIIDVITKALENIGVEVLGCLDTDGCWTKEEYCDKCGI